MQTYPPEIERAMKKYYATLSEKDQRRYAAVEALKLGLGGQSYMAKVLGCSEKTVHRGLDELAQLPEEPEYEPAVRQAGGGRKRYTQQHGDIDEQFLEVLQGHTAGDPMDEQVIWTDLTPQEIATLLEKEHQRRYPKPAVRARSGRRRGPVHDRFGPRLFRLHARGRGQQNAVSYDSRLRLYRKEIIIMHELRTFSIIAWIAIPTVMYGGYALLGMLTRGGLSEFQQTFFRAGHAHAGVLLLMSLLYHYSMEQTKLSHGIKVAAAVAVLLGILAQSGGFFLHMLIGQPGAPSFGTTVTSLGAFLLATAILVLVYGLIKAR
jgi:hypothetical protein